MKKIIFLVDMNSFFISCEALRHPEIADKPAAVAGDPKNRRGIILTANYEARKSGIKTTMPVQQALRLCPGLQLIPPDHRFYEDKSREVMRLLCSYTPVIEQNSIDEAWLDMTGCQGLFGTPLEAARNIMDNIKSNLGLNCSIGISENKFLSKMASEMKKPLGITELWKKDIEKKLWPLPLAAMYGIGRQTAEKLNDMGLKTIGDIAVYDKARLVKKLGKFGGELYELANGNDYSAVCPRDEEDIKSIGRSLTLACDITRLEEARPIILKMSEEVSAAARKHGKKGHTVQVTIKFSNFKTITRQASVKSTCVTNDIYAAGMKLLRNNWDGTPARLLGISLSGFEEETAMEQLSLFDTMNMERPHKKYEKLENTLDEIREKYGSGIINRAVFIIKEKGEK